jgi:hypothetical protein
MIVGSTILLDILVGGVEPFPNLCRLTGATHYFGMQSARKDEKTRKTRVFSAQIQIE